ncbi:MAG: GLUG motif-containing protein [Sandaracinaceae bacterium]
MTRRTPWLVLWSLLLVACDPGFALLLDVRSDLVPDIEVDAARVELRTADGTLERLVAFERDTPLLEGVRLAEFEGLEGGEILAQVFLQQGDQVVAQRAVVNVLENDQLITVLITRDCRDVECGEPSSATCLGGRCGSSECTPQTPENCEPECVGDADCEGGSPCSAPVCVTGLCVEAPDGDACVEGEYCDPDIGCRPLPEMDPCLTDRGNPDHRAFGAGTLEDPHLLCNGEQLSSLADAADDGVRHYRLGTDIDASPLTQPIALTTPFTGSLDGRRYRITALSAPLFGVMNGEVRDLQLEGEVVFGAGAAGLLAAESTGGQVTGVAVRGSIVGNQPVGLLIGLAIGVTLESCTAELTGPVSGDNQVGGLVGIATNCSALGLSAYAAPGADGVEVVSLNRDAGGLIGKMAGGDLLRASATLNVRGGTEVGGLVGAVTNTGLVTECSANGDVRGLDALTCTFAGGLVGHATDALVARSYATGSVEAAGAVAGGLVGWIDDGGVEDSYATGDTVAGPNGDADCSFVDAQIYTAGLVGVSTRGDIRRSWASGEAGGSGPVRGGLLGLGFDIADVSLSFSLGPVGTGTDTGGLIGVLDGTSSVADSTWDSAAAGNSALCGRGGGGRGCDSDPGVDTTVDRDYFFDVSNPPMDQWDFSAVWESVDGAPPRLRWQGE